ncbi:hypothetical protein GDO81_022966 [Engystomops pustulosus]|uniref:Uncharacterized protein n=1 Tax=Engystomops pustulosus TaxID=76066 RepID=A0AAV6ZIR5_ENGPU|nr:hypothetical protein GDO81_022966 [Engystomops pustulosus]
MNDLLMTCHFLGVCTTAPFPVPGLYILLSTLSGLVFILWVGAGREGPVSCDCLTFNLGFSVSPPPPAGTVYCKRFK